jgi:RNA polymerase sigma-70 factor, ECF subfamily
MQRLETRDMERPKEQDRRTSGDRSVHGGMAIAARNVITGAREVTRFFLALVEKGLMTLEVEYRHVNGTTAAVLTQDDLVNTVLTVHVDPDGRVSHIFSMRNPEKMAHIARATV